MITYSNKKEEINDLDLSGFFVGWPNPPSEDMLKNILSNSMYIWLAIDKNKPVGFITAISDGVLSAYIPLLEVLPQYQKHGIGKKLVEYILDEMEHLYMIDLCCDDDVVPFYEQFDLIKSNGLLKRNYHNLEKK